MSFGFGFGFPKRAGGGVAFPLDGLSVQPAVALSLARRLSTAYTGNAGDRRLFTVRRDGGSPGSQQVPYVDATGITDLASHDTFVGVNNGYVSDWWNQGTLGSTSSFSTATGTVQPATRVAGVNFTRNGRLVCQNTQGFGVNLVSSGNITQSTDTATAFIGVAYKAASLFDRQYSRSSTSGIQLTVQIPAGSGNRSGAAIDTGVSAILDPSAAGLQPKVIALRQSGTNAAGWVNANKFLTTSSATSLVLATTTYFVGDDPVIGTQWLEFFHWSGATIPTDSEIDTLIANIIAFFGIS
jgi:hypothetical protein